jgi:O-antigen biosynthesis protein
MTLLVPEKYRLKVFGKGWEKVPQLRQHHAGVLPYTRMPDVYKSVEIVVDDSNIATATWGSLNSRVFDALAAGALVLTNNVAGAAEHFGDALPTYSDQATLGGLIQTYLADRDARKERVEQLRSKVLSEHTYQRRVETFLETLKRRVNSGLRVAIKVAVPSVERCDGWGDWYFAMSLRRELETLGHQVRIDCLADWDAPETTRDDVNIVLRGLNAYRPNPRQINLMWLISHPNRVSVEELDSYDHVFVASKAFVQQWGKSTATALEFLPQCTDGRIFYPPQEAEERQGIVFIANSRLVLRPVVQAAVQQGIEVDVYGDGWRDLIPDRMVRATNVPNEAVGAIYRKAEIVLNDHWDDMRQWGFVSNRLFDAVACGAMVISDPLEGIFELFGPMVRTFDSVEEFGTVVRAMRAEPISATARSELAEHVKELHTFRARAHTLDRTMRRLDLLRNTLERQKEMLEARNAGP